MAEILALRQQLAILNRTAKRPSSRFQDRLFWIALSRFWRDWRSALLIVKPETVIKWHRQGFRLYWRWKSKAGRPGRPRIDTEIRELIRRISQENPLWGTPRIKAELHLLGFEVAQSTVAKYRIKTLKPSSQTWKTFLSNHAGEIIGIDFFTVPTATFRNLYCFIILLHERRQVVHFNITEHPTAAWTAQQMIEVRIDESRVEVELIDQVIFRPKALGWHFRYPQASPGSLDTRLDLGEATRQQHIFAFAGVFDSSSEARSNDTPARGRPCQSHPPSVLGEKLK
jgi:hypothetical protein